MLESLTHRLEYRSLPTIKRWVKNHHPSPQDQIFTPIGRKTLSSNSTHPTLVSKLPIILQEVHLLIGPLPITLIIWEHQPSRTSQQITKPDTLTSLSHLIKMKTYWMATPLNWNLLKKSQITIVYLSIQLVYKEPVAQLRTLHIHRLILQTLISRLAWTMLALLHLTRTSYLTSHEALNTHMRKMVLIRGALILMKEFLRLPNSHLTQLKIK